MTMKVEEAKKKGVDSHSEDFHPLKLSSVSPAVASADASSSSRSVGIDDILATMPSCSTLSSAPILSPQQPSKVNPNKKRGSSSSEFFLMFSRVVWTIWILRYFTK
ncbi:hypothetical protein WR25_03411 [Diploscapter pachys]|uniref:Uncharacterized protein n=1 Tax=Diploscapter pachys TaxID=2018661 RepID=A0A2A2LTN7_9BILA|nr:hypothetical protein WR25_03411 [Diploscapter pachys]